MTVSNELLGMLTEQELTELREMLLQWIDRHGRIIQTNSLLTMPSKLTRFYTALREVEDRLANTNTAPI